MQTTFGLYGFPKPTLSEIFLEGGNGGGGTYANIRRYASVVRSVGNDITYSDSAALGMAFTINTSGLYAMGCADIKAGGAMSLGFSVNTSLPSHNINDITYSQGKRACVTTSAANTPNNAIWVGYLRTNDVVRSHNSGDATDGAPDETFCWIVKLS